LVARMDEEALEAELADGALGFLDIGRTAARENGRGAVQRPGVFVLDFSRVVGPARNYLWVVRRRLSRHVMGPVPHPADVDAGLVVGVEHVLNRHRATPRPARPALAVEGRLVACLLGRIDVGVPLDDHALPSLHSFGSWPWTAACALPTHDAIMARVEI